MNALFARRDVNAQSGTPPTVHLRSYAKSGMLIASLMKLIALYAIVLMLLPAHAIELQHHDLRIVAAEDSEQSKRVIEALQQKFPAAQVPSEARSYVDRKKKPVYIAIGPTVLRSLLARDPDGPVFSVFVSNQTYRAILQETARTRSQAVTAIFADPAPADQMRLISLLYKRRVPVAVLVSERTSHLTSVLNQAAARADIDLTVEQVSPDDNLNRILSRTSDMAAVLAIPDSAIFNNENIRNILVTTYRSNQALIGFSTSMVKAGALATTYSSTEDIVAQLSQMLAEFDASGRLPEPQFPKYFNVTVNDNVARSLNLIIDANVRAMSRKPIGK